MRIHRIDLLAIDFDGTISSGGDAVASELLQEFASLRERGIKLILVTGRAFSSLTDLIDISIFDAVVLENGAIEVIGGKKISLAPAGWDSTRRGLLRSLKEASPEEEVILALDRTMEKKALRHLGSDARIELNKDRMMILPTGVSKESGLLKVLREFKVTREHVMCIGDAENDLAMFRVARLRIAVRNSVEILKQEADYVTGKENGKGVSEAIKKFITGEQGEVEAEQSVGP